MKPPTLLLLSFGAAVSVSVDQSPALRGANSTLPHRQLGAGEVDADPATYFQVPHPGSALPIEYVTCENRANGYGAAWLAHKDLVSFVDYGNRGTLEWHSFNLYNQVHEVNARFNPVRGHALKTRDPWLFLVNHVSQYEHEVEKRGGSVEKALASVHLFADSAKAKYCGAGGAPPAAGDLPDALSMGAIIPYYGGANRVKSDGTVAASDGTAKGTQTGNAHTKMTSDLQLTVLQANVCRIASELAPSKVIVGVCNAPDLEDVAPWVGQHPRITAVKFDCPEPMHLPFIALRHVQDLLKPGGAWADLDYVFFNEADQFVHTGGPKVLEAFAETIKSAPKSLYMVPHRFSKSSGSPATEPDQGLKPTGQNTCATPVKPDDEWMAKAFPTAGAGR